MRVIKVDRKQIEIGNVSIGYQYDHNAVCVEFCDLVGNDNYLKLIVEKRIYSFPIPENRWIITSTYTDKPYTFTCQLMKKIKNQLIENSPIFKMNVEPSISYSEKVKEIVPPSFQYAYDLMLENTEDIKNKLRNGEFDGQDGFSPIVKVIQESDGALIKIIDINGETSAKVNNTKDGVTPNIQIGDVITVDHDQPAKVVRKGTNEDPIFDFEIPKGEPGKNATIDEEMLLKLAIKSSTEGNPAIATDTAKWKNQGIEVYGQTEQVQTTGKNLLKVIPKLNVVVNGITVKENNGLLSINGIGTANGGRAVKLSEVMTLSAGTYYFSSNYANAILNDEDNNFFSNANKSFTLDAEKKVYIGFNFSKDMSYNQSDIFTQIEVGSKATSWEPYTGGQASPSPDYPQEMISKEVSKIVVRGKNLINPLEVLFNTTYWKYVNNVWSTDNGEATFCYANIYLKKGVKYILQAKILSLNGVAKINFRNKANSILVQKTTSSTGILELEYTPNEDDIYEVLVGDNQQSAIEFTDMYLSSVDNVYETFKEQTAQLSAPITLRGIPVTSGGNVTIDGKQYISDIIKEKDGIYGVERICYEKMIDSNNSWFEYNQYKGFMLSNVFNENYIRRSGYANKYIVDTKGNTELKNAVWFGVSSATFYIINESHYDNSLADKGLANFKAFLATNPIKIITYTDTPTFEPLPQADQEAIRKLMTYYPTTVFDTGAWSKLNYVADPKNYIDNLAQTVNQLKADVLKLGGN